MEEEASQERRVYECQVPIYALRPRDDVIVRFTVEARSDGTWEARRTGTVTFR